MSTKNKQLKEALTKTDKEEVKRLARKEIEKEMKKFDSKLEKEFKSNKHLKKHSKNISKKVLADFFKFLYMKKNVWGSSIKG